MISPFDMYFASIPVIAMKPTGCLRFPECPRAGEAGRMIFFEGQKAVPWIRANRDAADRDFSDLRPVFRTLNSESGARLRRFTPGRAGGRRALGSARRCHRAAAPAPAPDRKSRSRSVQPRAARL